WDGRSEGHARERNGAGNAYTTAQCHHEASSRDRSETAIIYALDGECERLREANRQQPRLIPFRPVLHPEGAGSRGVTPLCGEAKPASLKTSKASSWHPSTDAINLTQGFIEERART